MIESRGSRFDVPRRRSGFSEAPDIEPRTRASEIETRILQLKPNIVHRLSNIQYRSELFVRQLPQLQQSVVRIARDAEVFCEGRFGLQSRRL